MAEEVETNLVDQIQRLGTKLFNFDEAVPHTCECYLQHPRADGSRNCLNRVRFCFNLSTGVRHFTCGFDNHKRFGLLECTNGVTAEVAHRANPNHRAFVVTHVNVSRDSDMSSPVGGIATPLEQLRVFDQAIQDLNEERQIAVEGRDIARAERETLYNYIVAQSLIVSRTKIKINDLNKIKETIRQRLTFRLPWCPDTNKQDTVCSICYVADMNPQNSGHLLQCQHHFHTECIQTWFKKRPSCPICRDECNITNYYS